MTRIWWQLADVVSHMLEPDEREAVRGDLAESGATGPQALRDLLGIVVRRQAALWLNWRPWTALLGPAVIFGMLLNLVSRRLADGSAIYAWLYVNNWTWAYLESPGARRDLSHYAAQFFFQYATLACWSWTNGCVLGALSRRTWWITGTVFCVASLCGQLLGGPAYLAHLGYSVFRARDNPFSAAVFSLTFYHAIFPVLLQTVLVLLPALWGIRQGLRLAALPVFLQTMVWASAVATLTALVTTDWRIVPLPLAVMGPVGYLVATATWWRRRGSTLAGDRHQ